MEDEQTPLDQSPQQHTPQVILPDDHDRVAESQKETHVLGATPAPQANPTNQASGHIEHNAEQKPSKWRTFFIVLGVLQALGVALFFLIMIGAIQQANAGVSGTEFIAIIVFLTLVPAVGFLALINLVGLPMYLAKRKPRGKELALSIMSLLISLALFLFGVFSVYQNRVVLLQRISEQAEQSQQKFEERRQQYEDDNADPEITKKEAIKLIEGCELSGFYYTNQTKDNGGWGELSSTGVVLTRIDGQPYRISIADRLVDELVPIARKAQKTCTNLQFWHDGSYEQRQPDGTWR